MNYRGLILSLIGLVAVITGIVFAVRGIRHKDDDPNVDGVERTAGDCNFPLLTAVPSDATVIFSFNGDRDASAFLTDSASVIPSLLSGIPRRFVKTVASRKMAVSLHDAGSLTPLMILDIQGADSAAVATITNLADTVGLRYHYLPAYGLLLTSPSETLLGSSERHVEGGFSVLENRELRSAAAALPYGNAVFISHAAAARIIRTMLTKTYNPYAAFLSKAAVWTGFSLPQRGASQLEGISTTFGNSCYQSIFTGMTPGEFKFADIVPADAKSVTAFATEKPVSYCTLRRKWVDADGRLSSYKEANSAARKVLGMTAEQYLEEMDLKEAVSILMPSGERLVAIRYQKKLPDGKEIQEYKAGYALSMLFGDMFRPQADTLWSMVRGSWKWIGSRTALALAGEKALRESPDAVLLPDRGAFVLFNAGNAPGDVLSPDFTDPVRRQFRGASRIASCFTATPSEEGVRYTISYKEAKRAAKPAPAKPVAVASGSDTSVSDVQPEVAPTAVEYAVRNFKTGKMNTFFQNPDNAIGLRDETGKVLWTVPFDRPIASRVKEVDFYGNGKIQYLFAAGSRLYIIDRLGRFIPSFETDLGKEILIGPDLYGFTEDEYQVMVLHRDNTLSLYTLDGERYPGWKNITSKEAISGLPEIVTAEDKMYWKVPYPSGERYYNFEGGSPLSRGKTRKLLKKTVLKSE